MPMFHHNKITLNRLHYILMKSLFISSLAISLLSTSLLSNKIAIIYSTICFF